MLPLVIVQEMMIRPTRLVMLPSSYKWGALLLDVPLVT